MGTSAEEEVRAVLNQMLVALNAGDAETLGSLLLHGPDAVHIGIPSQMPRNGGRPKTLSRP